ncbi:unnamed protein product [Anisakis simplex]|uniref:Protein FAM161B n=1 Tax=Anisakis simplex TaxID=6269 RepID=A0A0M3K9K8_ANISI|nr:unnamed protein product [Anisakis simplex]
MMEIDINTAKRLLDQDESRLHDKDFMANLSRLRQQHKQTFSIIESLYNTNVDHHYHHTVAPPHLSTSEYDADMFGNAFKSINSCFYAPFIFFYAHQTLVIMLFGRHNRSMCIIQYPSDYCNRGYLGDQQRSKSMQSLLHSCECWQEEKTVQFTEEEWIPQITVPKPFKMTLRDEKRPIKATYSQKFLNSLMEEKQEQLRENRHATNKLRFKARQVPRSTYEPRYEQLLDDMERVSCLSSVANLQRFKYSPNNIRLQLANECKNLKAREERHHRAIEMSKSARRPFSAVRGASYCHRPLTNYHMRRCASADASEWQRRETFKANDVPLSVYLPPHKDEIQAAFRAKAKAERAIKMIEQSKEPRGMQIPDFKRLHQRLNDKLDKAPVKPTTIAKPFHFESDDRIRSHNVSFAHFCKPTSLSDNPKNLRRRCFSVVNLATADSSAAGAHRVRLNQASLLRNEAIKWRMQKLEAEKNRSRDFWEAVKEDHQIYRQRLRQRLSAEGVVSDDVKRKLEEKRFTTE